MDESVLRAPTEVSHLSAFTSSQTLRLSRSGSLLATPRPEDASCISHWPSTPLRAGSSLSGRRLEARSNPCRYEGSDFGSSNGLPPSERRGRASRFCDTDGCWASPLSCPSERRRPSPARETPLAAGVDRQSARRDELELQSLASTLAGSSASSLQTFGSLDAQSEPDSRMASPRSRAPDSRMPSPRSRAPDLLDRLVEQGAQTLRRREERESPLPLKDLRRERKCAQSSSVPSLSGSSPRRPFFSGSPSKTVPGREPGRLGLGGQVQRDSLDRALANLTPRARSSLFNTGRAICGTPS